MDSISFDNLHINEKLSLNESVLKSFILIPIEAPEHRKADEYLIRNPH